MTVGELVDQVPAAATVFEILRIDTCDKRERSLADASAAAGMDVDEIISLMLEKPMDMSMHPEAPAKTARLGDVTSLIRDQYHRRARAFLVLLTRAVRTLSGSHGQGFPILWQVRTFVETIARDLVPHMAVEEKYLFPYIESLAGERVNREIVVPLTGKVEYPLQFVRHDHTHDLETIAALRKLSDDFAVPLGACAAFGAFYGLV